MKRYLEASQATEHLRDLLAANGFDHIHPDPILGWKVFKLFAGESVNCADDSLHCELGISERTGTERYNIVFSRQFEINDEEKFYDHLEVIRLVFFTNAIKDLRQHHASLSTVGFRSLETFFTAIESLSAFQVVTHAPLAWQYEIKTWRSGTL